MVMAKYIIMVYWSYLLRCSDGSFYAGYTTDLDRRLQSHNAGRGARYTRSRRPVQLVYAEAHDSRPDAMRHEAALKRLSHEQKLQLVSPVPAAPQRSTPV